MRFSVCEPQTLLLPFALTETAATYRVSSVGVPASGTPQPGVHTKAPAPGNWRNSASGKDVASTA